MAFNSLNFWLLFPFIFVLYWLIPARWNQWRKAFLVVTSYLLYMNWNPAFALVLMGVTLITYLGGKIFDQEEFWSISEELEPTIRKKRKRLIWLFALLGLLPLLVFKYYNFLNESLSTGLAAIGLQFSLPGLNWAVPVGISFFTFQAVGYMLDVYHGRSKAEKSFLDYVLFVSFFPQVVSGPISTANELMPQIKATHKFEYIQGRAGLRALLWGMFLKLVVADRLSLIVDTVYSNYSHLSGSTCLMASVFYTLQIYGDFAGYSLMALGIAKTLGFNLINNFRQPYLAISITDFWKRWHISLTRWLTQQVYIPMGGSRCSKMRTYWNIFVTFLVSGIWHGANWTFIVWGMIHGVVQIIEKHLGLNMLKHKWARPMRIVITFIIVNFAWIFFRLPAIGDAITVIRKIFTDFGPLNLAHLDAKNDLAILTLALPIMVFKDFRTEFFPAKMQILDITVVRWVSYIVVFVMIILFGVLDSGQFLYVSF